MTQARISVAKQAVHRDHIHEYDDKAAFGGRQLWMAQNGVAMTCCNDSGP